MEQHIAYALEVLKNEINRLENELKYGHYLREDIEIMQLDIQRLKVAVSDISKQFDHKDKSFKEGCEEVETRRKKKTHRKPN